MADYLNLLGIIFFSLTCLWSSDVRAAYTLAVDIHSYINPSGRCDHCRQFSNDFPGCCDEEAATPLHQNCNEFETCDTTIEYCFRSLFSMETGGCPRNQSVSSEFAFSDINEHWPGSQSFFGVDLPIIFTSNASWTGVQLFLQSKDAVIVNNGFQDSLLIDSFIIDIDVPVGVFNPMPENFTGNASLAEITASFEVRCADNYYGPDCRTFCSNFVNCSLCGLPGYFGEFCQIDAGGCAGVDCGGNGRECVDRMSVISCVCRPGFTGDDCEIPIDYCEGVNCSDNGQCLNLAETFSCECVAGYTGRLCEQSSLCDPVACSGTGECIENGDSSLCVCDQGFTGSHCEIKLELDCEDEMCSGNGCWQRDRCVCNDGFSGQFCQVRGDGSISDTRTGVPVDAFMRDPFDTPRGDASLSDPHRGVVVIVGSVVGAVCLVLLAAIIILAISRGVLASKVKSKDGGVKNTGNGYTASIKSSPIMKARTAIEERKGKSYAHSAHIAEGDLDTHTTSSLDDERAETPCTTPTMIDSPELSTRNDRMEDAHAMAIVMESTDCHISLEKTGISATDKKIDTHPQEHSSSISTAP